MATAKLLNLRLTAEDEANVRFLRKQGVEISSLLREALRKETERRKSTRKRIDAKAMLRAIYEAHPDPADAPPPRASVHDRKAFREAIARHLRSETK